MEAKQTEQFSNYGQRPKIAAEILGVSVATIYNWKDKGLLEMRSLPPSGKAKIVTDQSIKRVQEMIMRGDFGSD